MKIPFILLFSLVTASALADGTEVEDTPELCGAGLTEKVIYMQEDVELTRMQGPPGKAGPKGEKGDVGQTGEKGEVGQTGSCSCAVTDERFDEITNTIQAMRITMQTLEEHMDKQKRPDCENQGRFYFGGKCFFVTGTKHSNFAKANSICNSTQQGSEVASITSAELYDALMPFIRPQFNSGKSYGLWTHGRYNANYANDIIHWSGGVTTTGFGKWSPDHPKHGYGYSSYTQVYLQVNMNPERGSFLYNAYDNWTQRFPLCSY